MTPVEYHELIAVVAGILGLSVVTVIIVLHDLFTNHKRKGHQP